MNKYYSDTPYRLSEVAEGQSLHILTKQPNQVDVVRFCSAIRNFHRFHFDQEFTSKFGMDGNIVPGFLMGNWCIEAVSRSFDPDIDIVGLRFKNTATAPIGQRYAVTGKIAVDDDDPPSVVRCEMTVANLENDEVVTTATVRIKPRQTQTGPAAP